PAGATGKPSPRAPCPYATAPTAAPAAFGRLGRQHHGSRSYCQHQQEQHQSRKHQREITADGEELQNVEPSSGVLDGGGDRYVGGVPDQVSQLDSETGRPCRARRPHLTDLARLKNGCAVNPADRLRKTRRRVLRGRTGVGITTIPGGSAPYLIRGQSMDGEGGDRAGCRNEDEDQ